MNPLAAPTPANSLADVLRVLHRLQPEEDADRESILAMLGYRRRSDPSHQPQPEATVSPPVPRPAAAAGRRPAADRDVADREGLPSSLLPLDEPVGRQPVWLERAAPLPLRGTGVPAYRRPIAPVFDSRWRRAIVTGLVARPIPLGEMDTARIVAAASRLEPLTVLPRRLVPSLRRGVQLLIDTSAGMQPFLADIDVLLRDLVLAVGSDHVDLAWFERTPLQGVYGATAELERYRLPAPGQAVLAVTDLGIGSAPGTFERRGPRDWHEVAGRLRRIDCSLVLLVPYAESRWPDGIEQAATVVRWDSRTGVRRRPTAARTLGAAADPGATKKAFWRFAELASIAARIEPQLLRQLRLELVPELDPGAEADVWFSPLVETRAATGIVLEAGAQATLRDRLAARPEDLDAAWQITHKVHDGGPPALLAEEELVYLSLKGLRIPAVRERAQALLRKLLRVLTDTRGEALTNWSERALLRLPEPLLGLEEAQLLTYGTAFRTGRGDLFRRLPAGSDERLGWLRPPATARTTIGVRLVEGGVELGPPGLEHSHEIEVPALRPLPAEIFFPTPESEERRRIEIYPGEPQFELAPASWVTLRFKGGQSFRLERLEKASQLPRVRVGPPQGALGSTQETPFVSTQEAPFVMGILSNLQGDGEQPPLKERNFVSVSLSTFESLFEIFRPALRFEAATLADPAGEDVTPASQSAASMMQRHQKEVRASRRGARREVASDVEIRSLEDFHPERLAGKAFGVDAVTPSLLSYVADHPGRRRLEAAWRGLYFLLSHLRSGQYIKLRLLSVSPDEFRSVSETPDPDVLSLLERWLEGPYREPDGEPFSLLIVDDEFGSAADFKRVEALAQVLERFNVPMLAGLAPGFFDVGDWSNLDPAVGLAERRPTMPLDIRGGRAARFVCLAAPRILAARHQRLQGLPTTEDPTVATCDISAAWALAVNIGQAFTRHGWLARIEGCEAGRLSVYAINTSEPPLTFRFSESDRRLLAAMGVTAIVPGRGPEEINVLDARTLALRIEREDEDLQSSEGPEARLSIVLNAARFAHSALLMMGHSRFGPDNRELHEWLASYVHAAPDQAMPAELAKRPLASGEIEVMPVEGAAERTRGGLRVRLAFQYDPRPREAIELRLSGIDPVLAV